MSDSVSPPDQVSRQRMALFERDLSKRAQRIEGLRSRTSAALARLMAAVGDDRLDRIDPAMDHVLRLIDEAYAHGRLDQSVHRGDLDQLENGAAEALVATINATFPAAGARVVPGRVGGARAKRSAESKPARGDLTAEQRAKVRDVRARVKAGDKLTEACVAEGVARSTLRHWASKVDAEAVARRATRAAKAA